MIQPAPIVAFLKLQPDVELEWYTFDPEEPSLGMGWRVYESDMV